ncbi:sialoadhesin-like [Trichomycterus rosablanca]|uniref:sialoadhesin-like n=1 Tax=Trichomycterus rosablanca TaxID=2290929 RepID=UPI002F359BB7
MPLASLAESDSWSAEVPDSVLGLAGSCVVIPCQFRHPGGNKMASHLTGIWFADDSKKIYDSETSKISSEFQGRTSLLGDLSHNNCSLKINHLRSSDKGPFMFRIEIKDYDQYTYQRNKVSVSVKDSPDQPVLSVDGEMKSGKKITTSCSVVHSCPSEPPTLTWSHKGSVSILSQPQNKGQWKMTSYLSFIPSKSDHNKDLVCTALFPGNKTVKNKKTLTVEYAPQHVQVISQASLREGDPLEMNCSGDGYPAPHKYQWFTEAGMLLSEGYTYTLRNVSRHIEPIYCTAVNTEGHGNSTPIKLNVMYPPEIKVGSSCTLETLKTTCVCIVNSDPASDIKWWAADESLEKHSRTQERHGTVTIATLEMALGFSDSVHCHASNSQGNNTMILQVRQHHETLFHNDKLLYILIAVAVFVVMIICLSVWIVKNCNRTKPPEALKTEMNVTSLSVRERKCKDLNTNNDGSQHVYSNSNVEEEDYPYECANDCEATYANI